jgi:hypothetical protein
MKGVEVYCMRNGLSGAQSMCELVAFALL